MRETSHLLLHTCCAPCAAGCWERLRDDGYRISLFYSNSNIYPKDEYDLRLEHVRKLAEILGVALICDSYDHSSWRKAIAGLEDEPERGKRCSTCFEFNLRRTALRSEIENIPNFTTTLTLSSHKVSGMIFEVGERFNRYLPIDFKKKGGFERSSAFCKEYGLYRQSYCGCEFSLKESEDKRKGESKR